MKKETIRAMTALFLFATFPVFGRTVAIDLGRLRSGPNVTVAAPPSGTFTVRVQSLVPGVTYKVTVNKMVTGGDKQLLNEQTITAPAIPPEDISTGGATYSCRALEVSPFGRLCSGSPAAQVCMATEEQIAAEVESLEITASACKLPASIAKVYDHTRRELAFIVPELNDLTQISIVISRLGTSKAWDVSVSTCAPETQLEAYLVGQYPDADMRVLAIDHVSGRWEGYRWSSKELKPLENEENLENDVANQPTLALGRRDKVAVLAVNTNPLIYSTTITETTRADTADLANLKQLVELAGGIIPVAIGKLTQPHPVIDMDPQIVAQIQSTRTMWTLGMEEAQERSFEPVQPPLADPLLALRENGNVVLTELEKSAESYTAAGNALGSAGKALQGRVAEVDESAALLTSYVQRLESGGGEMQLLEAKRSLGKQADLAFHDVLLKRNAADKLQPVCMKPISALKELSRAKLDGLPKVASETSAAIESFTESIGALAPDKVVECSETVRSSLVALGSWFASHPLTSPVSADEKRLYDGIFTGVSNYVGLVATVQSRRTAATEVLAKRGTVNKAAATYDALEKRQNAHIRNNSLCSLAYGVVEVARLDGNETDIPWSKLQSETVKISVDPTFKDAVVLSHPQERTGTYRLKRKLPWRRLEIDAAVTYTDITEPVFGVRTLPVPEGSPEGTVAKKVVDQIGEDSRAGKLALFVTPRIWLVSPQIGFGIETDKPSFYVGASGGWTFFRLSAGWTWQQLRKLERNQVLGVTEVGSAEEIKTRSGFRDDWYAALSITLNDLPFFQKK